MLNRNFDGAFGAEDFTGKAPLAVLNGLEPKVVTGEVGDELRREWSSLGSITCEGCTTGVESVSMFWSSISSTEIVRDGTGGRAETGTGAGAGDGDGTATARGVGVLVLGFLEGDGCSSSETSSTVTGGVFGASLPAAPNIEKVVVVGALGGSGDLSRALLRGPWSG